MPAKKKASASGATRRRRWWQLRMLWSMLGVFEINQNHDFYDLACFIKTGLQTALTDNLDPPPLEQLTADCFKKQETQVHEMQTFSGPVFSSLRRSLGLSEEEYRSSLSSDDFYLQFISNSKSKADFFITHDKRFFLKTQSHREVKFLLSNLPLYVDHLNRYPHSLLVRFMGVHKITVPNHTKVTSETKKYFIIMQSVFFPDDRISSRYDIKGCELGRWTAPTPQGSPVISVLKDNNFQGQITLGPERSWFEEQVELDSAFLRSLNVLDYSLLIGQQALHLDELDQRHSLATLVNRTTKSLDLDEGPPTRPLLERQRSLDEEQDSGVPGGGGVPLGTLPGGGAEGEFHARHRRLLPDFQNAVHVLDGPQRRYFVGIIDVFTQYGWRKRLEHWYKALRFPGRSFSTVSPHAYSLRLCQWVRSRTQ
ncbi:phosphatidylinositol 4-phosphate 5-kinase-like protein 1 isoform X2 [Gadus morhua]|uniref:phosphatidylinositol 4-phosphate 5-kinase-like protein 1 isoform X2 n=1 Tax=Gadus morhua TaxID=8049 RepID=UPI0011B40457|nr:phosphatidylinositol 4-phosphate 5-kinase-like protein 1 isoform X2 [Gadus morhua]